MKFGSKDIPFVYKGDKLVYPNPIKDGLLLWYDFKGMRNTDTNKEVAKDLSGNGNDGTLTNFNFTEGSGYKDNTLIFDGVDDKLVIPELELDETAMSVMQDGKLYAYEDDKVLTVGEDGEIEVVKMNLVYDSKSPGIINNTNWGERIGVFNVEPNKEYHAKIYIKPHDFETSIQFVFRREDLSQVKESGAGNWIEANQEGYVNLSYVAPEEASNAWIQLRNPERIEVINNVEIKDLFVSTSEDSPYSPPPKDYKTTTLTPASLAGLQLYNRTLHKNELLHNAESKGFKKLKPGVVVQDGLVLHYDFSHESNTSEYKDKAFDYSGNGNHGVLNNFNFTEESGYESKGLKFDGVDDYIETQDSEDFDITGNLTLEGTFYIPDDNELSVGGIIVKGNYGSWASNAYGIRSVVSGGNITQYRFFATDSNGEQSRVNISFEAGKLNYIVGVVDFDEGTITSYINGEKQFSNPVITDHIKKTEHPIFVGEAYSHNSLVKGNIYSARIYKKALTPEEIAHNYQIEKEKFNITEGDA